MTSLATQPVQLIAVDLIDPSPLNPRRAFAEDKLQALADSLRARGQLEAGIVRPSPKTPGRYELANGERRWRACQTAGIKQFAAKVQELSDAEMVELALAVGMGSNVESLNALEEAAGYAKLMELRKWSARDMAEHLGRTPAHVAQRLSLLNLPARARAAVEAGRLAARTAYYIASIPGEKARAEAAEAILSSELHGGVMPEGAALTYIRDHVCRPLRSTPFDPKDADLVPDAGACATCRFRAGNNPEEYGEVFDAKKGGGTDRCMHPACFDLKVEAHRERLLAKHATGGKVALSKEDNARAFPREEPGLNYASEFVDYGTKPTPDLLKKEVATANAPTWRELLKEAAVTIYVGVDQTGRVVELVKRDEAIASADLAEKKIFNDAQVKRGTATKTAKPEAGAPAPDSRAAEEKAEKQAREKAERARRKKERQATEWLATLEAGIAASGKAREHWHRLPFWTCLYDLAADALAPAELAAVVDAVDPDGGDDTPGRQRLDAHAAALNLPRFVALVARLFVTPRVLAEGVDGETARAWHEAILAEPVDLAPEIDPEAVPVDQLSDADKRQLNEIAKAHGAGMSVVKIARTFRKTIPEICGMLDLDEQAVYDEREKLDDALGEALHAAGVKQEAITGVIRGLLGVQGFTRADLAPEEFRHLIERLQLAAKAKAPAAAKEFPETLDEARVAPEARGHPKFEALLTDRFADWFEEIFIGENDVEGGEALLDREQAFEVICAIRDEEAREQVEQFAEWLGSGSRLAQPGAAWAGKMLREALAKKPAAKKAA